MRIKLILCALAGAMALHGLPASATEIRLARQFSMGYLQLNVMEHQQLIEKACESARPQRRESVVVHLQRTDRGQ